MQRLRKRVHVETVLRAYVFVLSCFMVKEGGICVCVSADLWNYTILFQAVRYCRNCLQMRLSRIRIK